MRQGLTSGRAIFWLLVALGLPPGTRGLAGPESAGGSRIAPLPDVHIGTRVAPILLLSRPDVCADLALTVEQIREAEAIMIDLHARTSALKGKVGPKYIAERKAIDETQRLWFESRLSPAQLNRLVQIDLQWEGQAALVTRPLVAHHLGLTHEQLAAMKQSLAVRDAARSKGASPISAEQALSVRTDPLLTPNQRLLWREMRGAPFVPQLASGGTRPQTTR